MGVVNLKGGIVVRKHDEASDWELLALPETSIIRYLPSADQEATGSQTKVRPFPFYSLGGESLQSKEICNPR